MSYKALYRKYRSTTFDEIVGPGVWQLDNQKSQKYNKLIDLYI